MNSKRRASDARYNKSDKGKASRKRYNKSDKGKANYARHKKSDKGRANYARKFLRKAYKLVGLRRNLRTGFNLEEAWNYLKVYLFKNPKRFSRRKNGVPDCGEFEDKVGTDTLSEEQIVFAIEREAPGGRGPLGIRWFATKTEQAAWHLRGGSATHFKNVVDFWLNRNGEVKS